MNIILLSIVIYLVIIFGIAYISSRKQDIDSYLLNEKSTNTGMLTLSNAATVIGGGGVVATISSFYHTGVMYGAFSYLGYLMGVFVVALVAQKIKSFGNKNHSYSILDFFKTRFDEKNKKLAFIIQMMVIIPFVGVQVLSTSALICLLFGLPLLQSLAVVGLSTIIYATIGGWKANIRTDAIQFIIMAFVFVVLTISAMSNVSSLSGLVAMAPKNSLNPFAPKGILWFLMMTFFSGFFYLARPTAWQQIFSARDEKTAARGYFYTMPIIVVVGFMMIFLGLYSVINQPLTGYTDTAFFSLIDMLLPKALVGIGFVAIFATTMSTVDSYLISGSTIFYEEFVKNRKKRSVIRARITTLGFGLASITIAALFPNIVNLAFFSVILGFVSAPAVLTGLYSKKISNNAVFYSQLIPFVVLIATYWKIGASTVMITAPLGIAILLFYDPIRKLILKK